MKYVKFIIGQNEREESTQNTTVTNTACACSVVYKKFIIGQNEREETTQDTIVSKSAACASYKRNYVTYITDIYKKRRKSQASGSESHPSIISASESESKLFVFSKNCSLPLLEAH